MQHIKLHESMSATCGGAESVRESLEHAIPPIGELFEFVSYMRALQNGLVALLSGDIRANPYFYEATDSHTVSSTVNTEPAGVKRLRSLRDKLVNLMIIHAEHLGNAESSQKGGKWSLLTLMWIVSGQATVCLERVRVQMPDPIDESSLLRNEIITSGGGIDDIKFMSMSEMRRAINLFRDRLCMLDCIDAAITRYYLLLELRAIEFALQIATPSSDYNVGVWMNSGDGSPTSSYITSMAWYFVWIKRYTSCYIQLSRTSFYSTEISLGRVCNVRTDTVTGRYDVAQFISRYAQTMNSDEHLRVFGELARQYNVSPGDLDADSYTFGMRSIERSTVADVVSRRRSANGANYASMRKYKRNIEDWVQSFLKREELVGRGRFVGCGAACEAFVEQIAILHALNAFLYGRMRLKFAEWFVVLSVPSGPNFELNVRRLMNIRMPFIVQRMGRFACIVPCPPSQKSPSFQYVETRLGIDSGSRDQDNACVMYDCADVLDALAVWATFFLECWDGVVIHSTNIKTAPFLKTLLGRRDAPVIATTTGSSTTRIGGGGDDDSSIFRVQV